MPARAYRMPGMRRRSPATAGAVVFVLLLASACASSTGRRAGSGATTTTSPTSTAPTAANPPPTTAHVASSTQWTTFANGTSRLSVAASQPSLDPIHVAWRAALDGAAVYAQPLIFAGRVFVATEGDDVYALSARDGHVLWKENVGAPLVNVASAAGCGDIDPLGITSTPVIDPTTETLYVVAEVSHAGAPPVSHRLLAIDVSTGRVTRSIAADPPLPAGESPVNLLQRAALALSRGRVYVGYGGQFGDCGSYHGWVVGVGVSPGVATAAFDVTPGSSGGAVWQSGGGPAIDSAGNVYFTTGNTLGPPNSPWAEAVVKVGAGLASPALASFQDPTATDDEDLGTGEATLLPDGNVFAVGKTDRGYLLSQSDLTLITTVHGRVCGSDPDGAAAYDAVTDSLYVPCRGGGLQQIDLATDSTGWHHGDVNASPILVNGALWALSYPGGTLQEIDPATGNALQTLSLDATVPNFATPAAAGGLLVAGTSSGVVGLSGPP